jgi:hypothetical protein
MTHQDLQDLSLEKKRFNFFIPKEEEPFAEHSLGHNWKERKSYKSAAKKQSDGYSRVFITIS